MRSLLKVNDLDNNEVAELLNRADVLHDKWHLNEMPQSLKQKRIALWFFGNGFRNRLAFEIGARAMGADISFVPGELGVHEPIEDIAHYLDNWFNMIVIRCQRFSDLLKVTFDSKSSIINARTNENHPCEILGDLQYIRRNRGSIDGLTLAFVGEKTNLCSSWFEAAKILPISVIQIAPREYMISKSEIDEFNKTAIGHIDATEELQGTINRNVDVLYTDCWPKSTDDVIIEKHFKDYQITKEVVMRMNPKGFYMPCPPITRGQEISIDSLETSQYCDFAAKEFLLHAQNAIMEFCLNENPA